MTLHEDADAVRLAMQASKNVCESVQRGVIQCSDPCPCRNDIVDILHAVGPRVDALVAEAVAAERERCARIAIGEPET